MAHEIASHKNQPQFPLQYWLGKTKPKQAFRSTQNASASCYGFFFLNLTEFSTD